MRVKTQFSCHLMSHPCLVSDFAAKATLSRVSRVYGAEGFSQRSMKR